MASEIAMRLAKHALVAHAQGRLDEPYQKALNDMAGEADRELQEVREALGLLQGFDWQLDDSPHGQEIKRRALSLSERLRVEGK